MDRLPPSITPQSRTWLELGELQRLLLDSYPGIVLGLDTDGRIRWTNPAASQRLGYGRDELDGQALIGGLISREEVEVRANQLSKEMAEHVSPDVGVFTLRMRQGVAPDEHDWVLRGKEGSLHPARLEIGALRNHDGAVVGLIAVEPAPRAGDEARLELAHHDSLTGLPTRAVLPDRAEMAIQRAARQHSVVAVLLIELADFDALCEERGHTVGDDLLRATASRLHFELRKTDTAVRVDRGQFVAMLVDLHHAEEARLVATKVQKALAVPTNVGVARLTPQVRVGVSWFPTHGDQLLPLLEAADAAVNSLGPDGPGVALAPIPGIQAEGG